MLTLLRHNPINAVTMGVIVQTVGLIVDEFRELFDRTWLWPGDYPSPLAYVMVGASGFNHPRKATGEAPQGCRMRHTKLRRGRDQL